MEKSDFNTLNPYSISSSITPLFSSLFLSPFLEILSVFTLIHIFSFSFAFKKELKSLKRSFQGQYYSFENYNSGKNYNSKKQVCFPKGDRFQDAAGINSNFPKCRGVFKSFDKPFMVWVNEEDHLRLISLRMSA
ncbi:MAG TPA: hypothetical protein ENL32_01080, partial [Methanomicrobia archaeon]|nr:hypothetical protein [Methanomicrobia archaeon]